MKLVAGEVLVKEWNYRQTEEEKFNIVITNKRIVQEYITADTEIREEIAAKKVCGCNISKKTTTTEEGRSGAPYIVFGVLFILCAIAWFFLVGMGSVGAVFGVIGLIVVIFGCSQKKTTAEKFATTLDIFVGDMDSRAMFISISSGELATSLGMTLQIDLPMERAQDIAETIESVAFSA